MPYKYPKGKGWDIPKQKYGVTNWAKYTDSLRNRGRIDVWISEKAIEGWYKKDRVYDGTGTPFLYSDLAIITCHEIRKVFKQPLRQTQGLIDSFFESQGLPIKCPDYTVLSKRLAELDIKVPRYRKTDKPDDDIAGIAIDSTGLKRFGRDEWHQEKYKISAKRSWRKLHVAVDDDHYIQAALITDRYEADEEVVDELLEQIDEPFDRFTADGAYDSHDVYDSVLNHSPNADVVIPPPKNAVFDENNHAIRNINFNEIKDHGRMHWQKTRQYGKRNYSELAIQRYKGVVA
ncbi:IS5 family transposase (plasmid) [Piscirickettsia salmonis]|uniref:IS5 family transposase n=1 Tax=Piscirickettsia salmonis TaxID=1238 RepID=UPI00137BDA38|nr:IS5 family transposase [Piscirickettsia salmonis]QHS30895.1 IS5 family transposase [Piscirickettsia salmonis]